MWECEAAKVLYHMVLSMISLISNVKEDWYVLFYPKKIIYTLTCGLSCQENIDGISRSFCFFRLMYLTLYFMEFIIYIFTTFTMAFWFCEKFSKVMHLLLIWKRTNYELLYTKNKIQFVLLHYVQRQEKGHNSSVCF